MQNQPSAVWDWIREEQIGKWNRIVAEWAIRIVRMWFFRGMWTNRHRKEQGKGTECPQSESERKLSVAVELSWKGAQEEL